jgi:hypothetical protein
MAGVFFLRVESNWPYGSFVPAVLGGAGQLSFRTNSIVLLIEIHDVYGFLRENYPVMSRPIAIGLGQAASTYGKVGCAEQLIGSVETTHASRTPLRCGARSMPAGAGADSMPPSDPDRPLK